MSTQSNGVMPIFAIAALIASMLVFCLGLIIGWGAKTFSDPHSAAIIVQTLAIVVSAGLAIWTYNETKKKDILSRHFTQKAEIYGEILDILKLFAERPPKNAEINDTVSDTTSEDSEMLKRLRDLQYKIIVWGDEKLIDIFIEIGENTTDVDNSFVTLSAMYQQMRRELGHKDRKTIGWDILTLLIKPDERAKIRNIQARRAGA